MEMEHSMNTQPKFPLMSNYAHPVEDHNGDELRKQHHDEVLQANNL